LLPLLSLLASSRHINRKLYWFLISLAYVLLVLLNWLACIMLFIALNNTQPQDTWLASVKVRIIA
jgi:hypothetical protein